MRFDSLYFLLIIFVLHQHVCSSTRKPLLVVSFDGLRADKFDAFVKTYPKSAFSQFIQSGVRAEYMEPSFPSISYPNHMTLVTGLYPESHGVVMNMFYDPNYDRLVTLTGPKDLYEAQWWNQSEPVWITAKKQGRKTAASMWLGSDIITRTPDIWLPKDDSYPFEYRIDDTVNYISKFKTELTFLYFEEPDMTGHIYGADSEEYKKKIMEMDSHFGSLIEKLKRADIYDDLNIIVVSDHGMVQTDLANNIHLFDYVDESFIDINKTVEYETILNIYPKPGLDESVYNSLKKTQNAKVYYKAEVPKEFHYSNNDRIAPIVVIVDEGYQLTTSTSPYIGNHGYNSSLESMRAIFMAHGPNFPSNKVMKPFHNINIYSLICELVGIQCNQNNGTIRPFVEYLIASSSKKLDIFLCQILIQILIVKLFV